MAKAKKPKAESGWWLPVGEFDRQRLLPLKGSWQLVRDADGAQHRAMQLSTRPGWVNTNFASVPNVVEWFKPADKFKNENDMVGKK
jgi:hypothetical protein